MSGTERVHEARPALLGVSALLFLVLWADAPFLTGVFAFKDDWSSLELGPPLRDIARSGRVVYAYLYEAVFAACRGLEDLRWVRLGSVLGACACGVAVASVAREHGRPSPEAWILGTGVALLPALQVPAWWASAFPYPATAAAATLAGAACLRAVGRWELGERRRAARSAALAALVLLTALHVYQPSAQFWFVPCAVALAAAPAGGLREAARRVAIVAAAFVAVGALHVAIFRAYVRLLPGGQPHWRTALVEPGEIGAKIAWYLGEALPNALRVFVLEPHVAPALATAAIAAVGLTLRWRRGGDSPLLGLAASAALLPLAYAANLASTGGWAALRTVGAASAVAWTLASAGALEIGGRFGPRGRAAALALLAAAVLAQAGQIHWRVPPPVVGLTLEEIEIVRTRLRELPRGFRFVVFRRPAWSDPGASLVVYDEIGTPSSTAEWVPESMLRRVHRDLTGQPLRARVEVLAPDDPLPGRGLVVDMGRELRRRARQRAEADRPKGGGS